MTRANFIAKVDAFLKRHDMKPAVLGKEALNDTSFVIRLKAGRNTRIDTMERVEAFMLEYDKQALASPNAEATS